MVSNSGSSSFTSCLRASVPPRLAHAFTLVELLVVIGIIALMISILLPALAVAKQSAMTTVCASNIRQLATCSIAYAADNHGYYPPAHFDFLVLNLHRWHGTRENPSEPFDVTGSPLRKYMQAGAIRKCPEFEPEKPGFEAAAGGYGYNNHFMGSSTENMDWAEGSDNIPARDCMIRNADRKIMYTDAAMAVKSGKGFVLIEYSFVEPPTTSYGPTSPSIHFRHRGKANIAWADGHVTSCAMDWTYPKNAYGADNQAAHLGFCGPKDNSRFTRE